MNPTRRTWALAALVVASVALAVVSARPLPLAAASFVGGWIVASQYAFARELSRAIGSLEVVHSVERTGLSIGETTPVTLEATLEEPVPATVDVEGGLPAAATVDEPLELRLDPGTAGTEAETGTVSWPVAGRHRFGEATVTVSDGAFRETVTLGTTPTVTVDPAGPHDVYVGTGSGRVGMADGEHDVGPLGSGQEPEEVREYVPGDRLDRIDWKTTARLGTTHVREYESYTNRRMLLVVDHRESLSVGPPDETKLDYLREAALGMTKSARHVGDPVGLLTVGDGGITDRIEAKSTAGRYRAVRRRLHELEPTRDDDERAPTAGGGTVALESGPQRMRPVDASRKHASLEGESDAFANTLRPFYGGRETYRRRIESDPLYGALRAVLAEQTEPTSTVLFTDDTRLGELRETVTLARARENDVVVAMAPTVLYEEGSLADVERAYGRYVSFEDRRREFARMDGVTALEVGPRDRLATVLAATGTERGGR